MKWLNYNKIKIEEIKNDKLETLACTDLGAFREVGKNNLKDTNISGIVIMEDRIPDFFITYNKFKSETDTTLNRHGPFTQIRTHLDLQKLIKELQEQGIKVYLGFWGQVLDPHKRICLNWLDQHQELWTLHKENKKNYDLDPLVTLQQENISFAELVVNQFTKLKNDFNFDGLFLGDGLNGYRLFIDPGQYKDKEHTKEKWTKFYKTIADGLHELDSKLLAYDCLGQAPDKAILHGADYLAQAEAGLDYLIVQTYPVAWGKKWLKRFPGFDFKSTVKNLQSTKEKLNNTNCKVTYTLEMGDSVEGWQAKPRITRKQLKYYKDHADAKLLVWGNDLFYEILK